MHIKQNIKAHILHRESIPVKPPQGRQQGLFKSKKRKQWGDYKSKEDIKKIHRKKPVPRGHFFFLLFQEQFCTFPSQSPPGCKDVGEEGFFFCYEGEVMCKSAVQST